MGTARQSLATALLALGALVATGALAQPRTLTWSAGQPSGGWYEQAGGIATMLKSKGSTLDIRPVPGAAYGNMTKLQQGEIDLAWSLPPAITAAYNGEDPFKGKQPDLRLVMTGLGFVQTHFCVADDSAIQSIRELFDLKLPVRIGSPRPGGSDEWQLRKVFAFYNTSYADLKARGGDVVFGTFSELATRFRERGIDAFVLNNAVPAVDVTEAARKRKLRLLPMDDDLLRHLASHGLVPSVLPRGSYPDAAGNDVDLLTAGMANTIVTSTKVPAEVIYEFTRALLGNVDSLRKVHPAFAGFDPRGAARLANLPLHPGAEKAFREAGLP